MASVYFKVMFWDDKYLIVDFIIQLITYIPTVIFCHYLISYTCSKVLNQNSLNIWINIDVNCYSENVYPDSNFSISLNLKKEKNLSSNNNYCSHSKHFMTGGTYLQEYILYFNLKVFSSLRIINGKYNNETKRYHHQHVAKMSCSSWAC